MRVPRDVDADELIKVLLQHGYIVIRQTGSHIRLSKMLVAGKHDITVPNHKPIKIGTLHNIVKNVCINNELSIDALYAQLEK